MIGNYLITSNILSCFRQYVRIHRIERSPVTILDSEELELKADCLGEFDEQVDAQTRRALPQFGVGCVIRPANRETSSLL